MLFPMFPSWEKYSHRHRAARATLDPAHPARHKRRMQHLEEKIAHLLRAVDDLSDTVARQDAEIAVLTRRVEMLMRREAEREGDTGGSVTLGDERPPHY